MGLVFTCGQIQVTITKGNGSQVSNLAMEGFTQRKKISSLKDSSKITRNMVKDASLIVMAKKLIEEHGKMT